MWGRLKPWGVESRRQRFQRKWRNAVKERISVKVEGVKMWGWIAPAKWRAELGILGWSDEQAKRKMGIQFENGDKWLVELRGSG